MNRGIHSRGYLPHWDFQKSTQAITFRLADSVPKAVILAWKKELASIPDESTRQKELHRRIARFEDAAHGEALLADPACAAVIQRKLIENHSICYKLLEWVVMPNHVHVLARLLESHSLSSIIQRWKGASATEINRTLNRTGRVWAPDYYDRYVRDLDHLNHCIRYIHNNPVKAWLCSTPADWPFSSAASQWSADFSPHAPTHQAD